MKKNRGFFLVLLFGLTASFLFNAQALAETNNSESNDGSDCGCSESGSSIYSNETSGLGTGYGSQTGSITERGLQDDPTIQIEGNESPSLIWVNLISIIVVLIIVVMLVRYRKSVKTEQDIKKKKGSTRVGN